MSKSCPHYQVCRMFLFAVLMLASGRASADTYIIDPKHTEVRFAYKMGLSLQWGRFKTVRGSMEFDAKQPQLTRVNAVIQTASLTVEETAYESALKGRRFFDAERRPEIIFQSNSIELTAADKARMTGQITVNGITQPITLAVSLKSGDDPTLKHRVGSHRFLAIGQISRSAFEMTAYSSFVADEIAIEIDALLKKKN